MKKILILAIALSSNLAFGAEAASSSPTSPGPAPVELGHGGIGSDAVAEAGVSRCKECNKHELDDMLTKGKPVAPVEQANQVYRSNTGSDPGNGTTAAKPESQ